MKLPIVFDFEMIVVSEVPAIINNEEARSKFELHHDYLTKAYSSKSDFQVVKFSAMIKNINNWSFFWDNIHLNDNHGVLFLRKIFCFIVCQYSNNMPRSKSVES